MSDSNEKQTIIEMTSDDIKISESGAVEMVNIKLNEMMKSIFENAKVRNPDHNQLEDSNNGCGNNLYQCSGSIMDKVTPVKLVVKTSQS